MKNKRGKIVVKNDQKMNRTSIPEPHVVLDKGKKQPDRRKFLMNLAGFSVGGAFLWSEFKNDAFGSFQDTTIEAQNAKFVSASTQELKGKLPYGKIKNVEISKMFMGCNLMGGWLHSRDLIYVSQLGKQYHTKEKIFETLLLGEECGMNTIILNTSLCPVINSYWKEARGKMQFISDCAGAGEVENAIKVSIDSGAAMCYIQGEITDRLLRQNKSMEIVGEWIEKIRQHNVPAGIGAHSIGVIKQCVELGIKPDYWVKTIHHHNYWSARPEEPRRDNIWCYEPEETIKVMSTLEEPWIGFKVLAAGAIRPQDGFKYAFESGADFICVGMFDFQIVNDVNVASEILSQNISRVRPWRA